MRSRRVGQLGVGMGVASLTAAAVVSTMLFAQQQCAWQEAEAFGCFGSDPWNCQEEQHCWGPEIQGFECENGTQWQYQEFITKQPVPFGFIGGNVTGSAPLPCSRAVKCTEKLVIGSLCTGQECAGNHPEADCIYCEKTFEEWEPVYEYTIAQCTG